LLGARLVRSGVEAEEFEALCAREQSMRLVTAPRKIVFDETPKKPSLRIVH
jgi:hypothetical protein